MPFRKSFYKKIDCLVLQMATCAVESEDDMMIGQIELVSFHNRVL